MQISRRSTVVYGSALAALAANPAAARLASVGTRPSGSAQIVQHMVIHGDEAGGNDYSAPVSLTASNTLWATPNNLDASALRAAVESYRQRGYGLRRVNAFQTRNGVRYSASLQWGHAQSANFAVDMTPEEFHSAVARFAAQGLAVAHVDGCATAQGVRFSAIWEKAGAAQKVVAGLSAAQYRQQVAALAAQGFRVSNIAGYAPGGRARFAAVFTADSGAPAEASHAIPAAKFPALKQQMMARGYRLRDASGYVAAGRPFYTGVWEQA